MTPSEHRRGFWHLWNRFWFQPADPLPLGLMRIVAGSLILYIHLAYCLDFADFFGPSAWWTQETANRERREVPNYVGPLIWRAESTTIRLPELPHRRQALLDFFRRLPDDPKDRIARVLFLSTLCEKIAEIGERRQFLVIYGTLNREQRATLTRALAEGEKEIPLSMPAFFQEGTAAQKSAHLREADALLSLLPPVQDPAGGYVLDWFQDSSTAERLRFISFIEELPSKRAEREEILNYLEFWNADPRLVYSKGKTGFSPWFHLRDPIAMKVVHGIVLAIFFLFTIGLWTRVNSVLAWLAALSYIHRSPPILYGIDALVAVLLLYLMIGPSGAALSVDRLRARFRAARAANGGKPVAWAEAVLAGPRNSRMANCALRLFQIHFCVIYAISGLAKLKGLSWWNNTASWMALVNPSFSLIHNRLFESLVLAMAEFRPLLALYCGVMVAFTLVVEITFPIFVWSRWRPRFIIASIILHAGIAFQMGMAPFELLTMTFLLAFIPAAVICSSPGWVVRRGSPITLHYDAKDAAQQRTAATVRALDIAGQVTMIEGSGPMKLNLADGTHSSGPELPATLMKSLMLLRPLGLIPGVRQLSRRLLFGFR